MEIDLSSIILNWYQSPSCSNISLDWIWSISLVRLHARFTTTYPRIRPEAGDFWGFGGVFLIENPSETQDLEGFLCFESTDFKKMFAAAL